MKINPNLNKNKVNFIVGPHRSGTTFLQTLLGCMPEVATGIETHFFCRIRPYLREIEEKNKVLSFSDIRNAVEKIMFKAEKNLIGAEILESSWLKEGWPGLFFTLISSHFVSVSGHTSPIYIEKTPGHIMNVREIKEDFPDSKFIVIYRDPRAIATSMLKFVPGISREKRMGWLKKEIGYINSCFEKIKDFYNSEFNNIYILRYEDLLKNQDKVLKEICVFLEIEYQKPDEIVYKKVIKNITLDSETHKFKNRLFQQKMQVSTKSSRLSIPEYLYVELSLNRLIKDFGYKSKNPLFFLPKQGIRYLIHLWNKKIKLWDPLPKAKTILDKYIPWSPENF